MNKEQFAKDFCKLMEFTGYPASIGLSEITEEEVIDNLERNPETVRNMLLDIRDHSDEYYDPEDPDCAAIIHNAELLLGDMGTFKNPAEAPLPSSGTEEWLKDAVKIDGSCEPMYGSDQMNISYPRRFATVSFVLESTDPLMNAAEHLKRLDIGDELFHKDENSFDFSVGISDIDGGITDNCITAVDCDTDATYQIIINDDNARKYLYGLLSYQCKETYHKSCDRLLDEAKDEMNLSDYVAKLHASSSEER